MGVKNLSDNIKQGINPEELYERIELVGEGSFGNVHKARLLETNDIIAVKIVKYENEDELLEFQVCRLHRVTDKIRSLR